MAKLKEAAMTYEPPTTLNIADLESVSIELDIKTETHKKKETDEEFTVNVVEVEGKKYRVPASVLEGMKAILTRLPETKRVAVLKSGSGMGTTYQVIPFDKSKPPA